MKKFLNVLITACILVTCIFSVQAEDKADIIILFENDVHCAVDGYAYLAALKADMQTEAEYVGVVSSGDYIQGRSLGVISKGEYIVNIMNKVGYDAVTLGNHEFDYKLPRLMELVEMLDAPVTSCNFKKVSDGKPVFSPYTIVSYGDIDIAYVGITTPGTLTSSSPAQFKDENGEYIYSFSANDLYPTVQAAVNAARENGADYVVALAHVGTEYEKEEWMSPGIVKNTTGIDAVLDGHSHSVVPQMSVENKDGKVIPIASTGTAFANIGKLVIKDGVFTTSLIAVDTLEKADEGIVKYVEEINADYQIKGNRKIGESKVTLRAFAEDGTRLIRNNETNLGNLCADAYREVNGTDIAFVNGGGVRANIETGDVTFNTVLSVFPWNNSTAVATLTGQQIADAVEFSVMAYPNEKGGFLHFAGVRFVFDPQVSSSIEIDENEAFVKVGETRRTSNIEILSRETGKYEPIDLQKKYTVAASGYLLKECGDGYTMFAGAENLVETGSIDMELLETYITENLGGVIPEKYAEKEGRINVVDEYVPLRKTFEAMNYEVIWTALEPDKIVVNTPVATLVFKDGSKLVSVNEKTYEADRVTYIENGVTYISADCVGI